MSMRVITPGMLTTIQDGGRIGYAALGFSQSGVMDMRSYHIANALAGNYTDEAVLEMTFTGGSYKFLESNYIAVTGADMRPRLEGSAVPMYETLFVRRGQTLSFSAAKNGMRTYLAVYGGIDVPVVMDSRSTNLKCGLGGLEGRALRAGDIIPFRGGCDEFHKHRMFKTEAESFAAKKVFVRTVLGPQDDYFTEKGIQTFLHAPFTVTQDSDRMGCKLSGDKIEYRDTVDIVSDGIVFGSVQVPRSGNPIVMLADRQTTGGYAKIATVISADLPLLAQAAPGTEIYFQAVTRKAAEKIAGAEQKKFYQLLMRL